MTTYEITVYTRRRSWTFQGQPQPIHYIPDHDMFITSKDGTVSFGRDHIEAVSCEEEKPTPEPTPDGLDITMRREAGQDMTKPWWRRW